MAEYWVNNMYKYHKDIILKDEEENGESNRIDNEIHNGENTRNPVNKWYIERTLMTEEMKRDKSRSQLRI